MENKIIYKIYENVRNRKEGLLQANEAFLQDSEYFIDVHGRENVKVRLNNRIIEIPGYHIHYLGNVAERPWLLQGAKMDVVEIFEEAVPESFINEIITPSRARVIRIDRNEGSWWKI